LVVVQAAFRDLKKYWRAFASKNLVVLPARASRYKKLLIPAEIIVKERDPFLWCYYSVSVLHKSQGKEAKRNKEKQIGERLDPHITRGIARLAGLSAIPLSVLPKQARYRAALRPD
jgi:hypothetical protein